MSQVIAHLKDHDGKVNILLSSVYAVQSYDSRTVDPRNVKFCVHFPIMFVICITLLWSRSDSHEVNPSYSGQMQLKLPHAIQHD